jgi:hypothetical protein
MLCTRSRLSAVWPWRRASNSATHTEVAWRSKIRGTASRTQIHAVSRQAVAAQAEIECKV